MPVEEVWMPAAEAWKTRKYNKISVHTCTNQKKITFISTNTVLSLKQYVCKTCDAEFKTVDEIENHIETHEEKYKCTFCSDLFSHMKYTYNYTLCLKKTINETHYIIKSEMCCKYYGNDFNDKLYLNGTLGHLRRLPKRIRLFQILLLASNNIIE